MTRPRIRSVKPEMWADEKIGDISRDARLLFIGLITMADDDGRMRAQPAAIIGHVFPYDEISSRQLEKWLVEIASVGLLLRYEHKSKPYIALLGWEKHQRINRKTGSELPTPPGSPGAHLTESSVSDDGAISEDARSDQSLVRAGALPQIGSDQDLLPPPTPSSTTNGEVVEEAPDPAQRPLQALDVPLDDQDWTPRYFDDFPDPGGVGPREAELVADDLRAGNETHDEPAVGSDRTANGSGPTYPTIGLTRS